MPNPTDEVLREITILGKNLRDSSRTCIALRKALLNDPRFASLRSYERGARRPTQLEIQDKTGPEGLTDPFSSPLESSHD